MVFSGIIIKIPYLIVWKIKKHLNKLHQFVIYVDSYQDYKVFESVLPHLKIPYLICAKNRRVKNELRKLGIESKCWPLWGKIVLMARHALHKFPVKEMKKIGMRHGPYHFKNFISSCKYNVFDLYLFTSEHENRVAFKRGIIVGKSGGYPKLDLLKSSEVINLAKKIRDEMLTRNDKLLLFSATWSGSGMSAIQKWIYRVSELTSKYKIAVTIHPKMKKRYIQILESNKHIFLVKQEKLPQYMNASDILISDTSSIIAEFCALNKPIITFKVDSISKRLTDEINTLIRDISIQIDSFDDIFDALEYYEKNNNFKKENREYYNKIMFDSVDIGQGKKCADIINSVLVNKCCSKDHLSNGLENRKMNLLCY